MAREVELINYFPQIIKEIPEFQQLAKVQNFELNQFFQKAETCLADSLIKEAGLSGIKRYEKLLGIASDSRLSLEERRAKVLMRWNRQLPYTLRRLVEQLRLWSGEERFTVDTSRFADYELWIEVYNQTLAALHGMKETVLEMLPANLLLFFYGRYPMGYKVPVLYDNAIHFGAEFHPRYNLPYLRLDHTWALSNSRWLNSYDSSDVLDFYPVSLRIQSGIRAEPQTEQRLHLTSGAGIKAETETALQLHTEAAERVRTGEQIQVRGAAGIIISSQSRLHVAQEVRQEIQAESGTRLQAEAALAVCAAPRVQVRAGTCQEITTASYMTKLNRMDRVWAMSGSRKLDGGRYVL